MRSHWKTRLGVPLLLFATATLLACQDLGPDGPEGHGSIHVDLVSPNGAEGSAVFEFAGGSGLGVVTAFGGEVYYSHNYGTGTSKVVVIMDTPGQIQFRIRTSDVGDQPSFTVLQVADGNDVLRPSLSGYDVEIVPVKDEAGE
jgi:hypothetical protein